MRSEKAVGRGVTRLKDSGSLCRGSSLGWTMGVKLGLNGSSLVVGGVAGLTAGGGPRLEAYTLGGWKVE